VGDRGADAILRRFLGHLRPDPVRSKWPRPLGPGSSHLSAGPEPQCGVSDVIRHVIPRVQTMANMGVQQATAATCPVARNLLPLLLMCCLFRAPEEGLEPPTR
jgi:hypothetical protein